MAITSIDIDAERLGRLKELAGARSNREAVDIAIRTYLAVRDQPTAVDRIVARTFDDDQIDAGTMVPSEPASA
ncbi:hypothetical protein [Brevibacterium samyangense]|uniref:VapB protein of antitoxin of type II toxin-antitoxin system n=1 Tax=Brevibacterium samyangense TaxID=366888 RepID=A0ABN2TBA8_9MICO